jgi:drug/metabolite transporter (DMT)-like permease
MFELYLLLVFNLFIKTAMTLFCKFYSKNTEQVKGASSLFNLIQIVVILFTWGILYFADYSFEASVLWYALLFGVLYFLGNIGYMLAIKNGPLFLSNLFLNLSSVSLVVWGFFFWGAKVNALVIIALIMVVLSVFLCMYKKKEKQDPDEKREKITLKWIVYMIMAFVGNAGVGIVSRTQQMVYNGQHGNMLMFYGTMIAVIVSVVDFIRVDKADFAKIEKKQSAYPVLAGVTNFIVNLLGLYFVSTPLSTNIIYPVLGVGCLMLVTIASKFIFKEKMAKVQWAGVIVGAVAIALLSIVK